MEKNIFYLIKELDKSIIKNVMPKDTLINNHSSLNPTQMRIVEYILNHQNKSVLQSELEDKLKLSRATISDVLHRMELKKLIIRQTNPEDSRSKKIVLSSTAKEFFDEGKHKIEVLEQEAVKGLTDTEINNFVDTCNKILKNINDERNNTIEK